MECWLLCLLIFTFSSVGGRNMAVVGTCNFPAVFNFGDSNSDTGGDSAAIKVVPPPNGETYLGKPSGRFCDGRLIIDFIAGHLGLPYLSPYLDSVGADFRKGANFAVAGASIKPPGYSPFHLHVQISQFQQFKARSIARFRRQERRVFRLTEYMHRSRFLLVFPFFLIPIRNTTTCKSNTPNPDSFSKALYTFDIGQNDLQYGLQRKTEQQVNASIPDLLVQVSTALQTLYTEGARVFWVHNTGPIGCLPNSVIYIPSKSGKRDHNGCVKPQNEVAREFNSQLKDRLVYLGNQLPNSTFTYVDIYSAKYDLISRAKQQGFTDPMDICCGGDFDNIHVDCGTKVIVNGTVYGNPCSDPSRHISWDSVHYSEAANHWVAKKIINGSLSEPPIAVDQSCHKPLKV